MPHRLLLEQAETARRTGQIAGAIALAQQAVAVARDDLGRALSQIELANLLRYVPDTLQALQLVQQAEPALRSLGHIKLARALTMKGMALGDAGHHNSALDCYREALALLATRSGDDPCQEAATHGAVGLTCTQLGEFDQAAVAYRHAIALYDACGQREAIPFVLNNLAILVVRDISQRRLIDAPLERAREAQLRQLIDEGLELNRSLSGNPLATAMLLNTLGDGLRALGQNEAALQVLIDAQEAFARLEQRRGEIDVMTDIGATLLALGRLDEALDYFLRARSRLVDADIRDHERRLAELIAQAHEALGDPVSALDEYKNFMRLTLENQDRDVQRKLQQLALREEIDKALRASREDPLTGLANRRSLDDWTQTRASNGQSLAVAVVDVDHFKRINDTFSHAAGDAVLRALATILRGHCRPHDFVGRMGGEEFILIICNVDVASAQQSAERLCKAIESHAWPTVWEGLTAVTASIGVALGNAAQMALLTQAADHALYEAKAGGRNKVVLAAPDNAK
jgi:diguanylate cyclase (GGDEF)-like protein